VRTSKTSLRLALVLMVSLAIEMTCEEPVDDVITIISGIVTDSVTGVPIESALIGLNDTTKPVVRTYTDTLGAYTLDPFGWGRFDVYCLKTGYLTKWTTIQSSANKFVFDSVNFQLAQ
jgi:hypothetical protein